MSQSYRPLIVFAVLFWLALLVLPAAALVPKKPLPCLPSEVGGAGVASVIDVNATGAAGGWWCTSPRQVVVLAVTWPRLIQSATILPSFAAAVALPSQGRHDALQALWQEKAGPLTDVPVDLYAPILARLAAAAPPLPTAERWVVPKAGATASPPGTRPTYRLAPTPTVGAGQLVADGGRVAEGSPCDLAAGRFAQGAQTFGSVLGQAGKLALCAKVVTP